MITFKCSKCKEVMEAPESMTGEMLQCPKCKFPERVPESEEEPEPIAIEMEAAEAEGEGVSEIRIFEDQTGIEKNYKFKRSLNQTSQGATRVRTFHARLSDPAMKYLDEQINTWVDDNPDIEIKSTNTAVGMVEGKRTESHLIVSIWY